MAFARRRIIISELKPRLLAGLFFAPRAKPRARPFGRTYPAGRALLGVLLSPEMLLVVAVAAFTVLVAVIEWRRRDKS